MAAGLAGVLIATTLVALEGGEVVVLRTRQSDGAPRDTRTWIADEDEGAWIEVANPERPFLEDVLANPDLELQRAGVWHRCRGVLAHNPEGHERIRRLLREKYGWKDRWIGMLVDTSDSLAMRLGCETP
jgi:hypothetical protein